MIERGTPAFRNTTIALFAAGFVTFGLLYCVQPLLPEIGRAFGKDAAGASLALSSTTGVMAFAMLGVGALADTRSRKPLMVTSLFASSLLVLASAAMPAWHGFLVVRALLGLSLSGLPAVAMTYVSEEVHPDSLGLAMGLYIAGTGIGGMSGRLVAGVASDFYSWRVALAVVGLLALVASAVFARLLQPSRHFAPSHRSMLRASLGELARDPVLPWLFAEGFVLMGCFVTIYNYTGYRLAAPPFSLRPSVIGLVFLVYPVGGVSSTWAGREVDRRGPAVVLAAAVSILLAGVLLTAAPYALVTVLGLALLTIGFFAGHSVASSWVGQRVPKARAQASAIYLFAYYMGSSLMGAAGGVAWTRYGWFGVLAFVSATAVVGLGIALRTQFRMNSKLS